MGVAAKPLTSELLERIIAMREQGHGKILIARATGLNAARVRRILERHDKTLAASPEEIRAKAQTLADQGMSADEIAKAMGTSRKRIKSMALRVRVDDMPDQPTADDYEFRLALNVLIQAARDLTAAQDEIRQSARDWIMSDSYSIMSFMWICDHCEVDHRAIRRAAARPDQLREAIRMVNRRHPDSHNRRE